MFVGEVGNTAPPGTFYDYTFGGIMDYYTRFRRNLTYVLSLVVGILVMLFLHGPWESTPVSWLRDTEVGLATLPHLLDPLVFAWLLSMVAKLYSQDIEMRESEVAHRQLTIALLSIPIVFGAIPDSIGSAALGGLVLFSILAWSDSMNSFANFGFSDFNNSQSFDPVSPVPLYLAIFATSTLMHGVIAGFCYATVMVTVVFVLLGVFRALYVISVRLKHKRSSS